MANYCGSCGKPVSVGAKFCKSCGSPVAQATVLSHGQPMAKPVVQLQKQTFCRHCGKPVSTGAKFCGTCGNSLVAAAVIPQAQPKTTQTVQPYAQPKTQLAIQTQPKKQQMAQPQPQAKTQQTVQPQSQTKNNQAVQPQVQSKTKQVVKKAPVQNAMQLAAVVRAPASKGMTSYEMDSINRVGALSQNIVNPFRTVMSFFPRVISGFKNIKKRPLSLIAMILIPLIWILLFILRRTGNDDNIIVKILSWLSYGGDAGNRSLLGVTGSVIGRGTVALAYSSLLTGGLGKLKSGVKGLFSKQSVPGVAQSKGLSMGWLITGTGAGLIMSRFVAGIPSWSGSMAIIATMFVSLQACGNSSGYLYSIARSITSRVINSKGGKTEDKNAIRMLLMGFIASFACMIPYSAGNSIIMLITETEGEGVLSLLPLITGIVLLIVGMILVLIGKKKINKQAVQAVMSVILVFLIAGQFGMRNVNAEEHTGYWKYTGTEVDGPDVNLDGSTMTGGNGHFTCTAKCLESDHSEFHDGSCVGESVTITIDVEEPPKTTLKPGQEVTMAVNASFTASNPHDGVLLYTCKVRCNMGTNQFHNREIDFLTSDGAEALGIDRTWEANDFYGYGGHFVVIGGDQTFRATIPDGYDGEVLWIRQSFSYGRGEDAIDVYYNYEWVDTTSATAATTQTQETTPSVAGWVTETEEDDDDTKIDLVIDSNADKDPGLQDGGSISDGIVEGWKTVKDTIAAAGGIAAAISAIVLGLTDNKKYRMVIYKNFGDVIRHGEEVFVYACIVERDEKGNEHVNLELTGQINIFSTDGTLNVYEAGALAGEYKAAQVSIAPDAPKDLDVGIVSFKFTGKGGSFTNRMKFKLEEPRIIFYQENLALPAGYEDHEALQFTVKGFNLDNVKIKVETSEGSSYEAEYVPSENVPGTYFAIITDVDRSRQEAGTVANSMLYVTASDDKYSITEGLPLLRVNEGLNVALPALNCYRAPLDSAAGKSVEELTKDDFVPATSTARVILVLYNAEDHTIDQMPVLPEFELVPVDTDPVVKQRVDELGIEAKLTKVERGYSEVTFFCTKAYLEPPCRFRINLKASYTFEGKTYNCEKEVLMRSQPVRLFQSAAEESQAAAADKEVERKLDWMLTLISRNNWESELTGEVMIARLLLDNYEWTYGYDALLTYQVLDNFYQVMYSHNRKYLIENAELNRLADPERDDWCHELEYRTRFLDSWGGIAVRIGLAIGTGGWSEAAFLALDVNRAVVQYNDATPKEQRTTWGQVKAGAVPVAIWLAFAGAGKAATKVVPKVGAWASSKIAGSKFIPQKVKNVVIKVGKYFTEKAENVKNCDPKNLGTRASQAEAAMNAASKQGEAEASALLKSMSGDMNSLEKLLAAAQKAGDKEGAALLKEIKIAVEMYKLSGEAAMTEGALKQNIIKLCQNKFAIEQLIRENPGQVNVYRKLITSYRNKFLYDPIKKDSCKHIAEMLNCDPRRISIKSVSGNTAEALEKGTAFAHDLDVTFVYKNAKGEFIELPQAIAEDALYKTTCRHAGVEFKNLAEARAFADKLQIHACQPSDAERLPEVQKFLDKLLRTEALEKESVGKFINAENYKTVTPYRTGMTQIQKACPDVKTAESLMKQLEAYNAGRGSLSKEAQSVIEGVGNVKDGFRFLGKGCNNIKFKGIGGYTLGGKTGLNSTFHTVDGAAKYVASGQADVATGLRVMDSMGGFENCANNCFSQMGEVNKVLQKGVQAGTGNVVPAVSGAIGNGFTQGSFMNN